MRWARSVDRPLPWRGERDPYRVLVSEVMLQQTQAARVAASYPAFLELFPTAADLARAEPDEVLRAWGDLGYPRRAMNLWRAARTISVEGFPATVEGLERLPGVGPYTARAIASFAFGLDVGVVEANVRRIFTRYFGEGTGDLQTLADEMVLSDGSAVWNQALMDLGALVCRPRGPRCDSCPLAAGCLWRRGERRTPADVAARRERVPFEQTLRFARGRVLRALRARSPLGTEQLIEHTGLEAGRLDEAVRSLSADELVHVSDGCLRLGPQRARERRSSASATR